MGGDNAQRLGIHPFFGGGNAQPVPATIEQPHDVVALQLPDRKTDRRLGNVEPPRRRGNAARASYGDEYSQMPRRHATPPFYIDYLNSIILWISINNDAIRANRIVELVLRGLRAASPH